MATAPRMDPVDLEAELERARAAAQSAREELQGFVYAASHDVKEALRGVASYAQLLVRQAPPNPDLTEYGHFVTEGVKSAVEILDRMNAFARIDPEPPMNDVALGVVAQMTLLTLASPIRSAGAEVTVGPLPHANASEAQVLLLFENLVGNALKFRTDTPPRISITGEETDDGVLLSVSDNGPGVAPEYHQLIFKPFRRLHGKTIPGIGLGLAMCDKVALAHHGKIWVESDGTSGSDFKILLPF